MSSEIFENNNNKLSVMLFNNEAASDGLFGGNFTPPNVWEAERAMSQGGAAVGQLIEEDGVMGLIAFSTRDAGPPQRVWCFPRRYSRAEFGVQGQGKVESDR